VSQTLQCVGLDSVPLIEPGDDLAEIIASLTACQIPNLAQGAILVLAQKVVSKAEGRQVDLQSVAPGAEARALAEKTGKDPRLVELILAESRSIVRTRPGLIIAEHRSGHILANAGIDASNIPHEPGTQSVLLWPKDPDASAQSLAIKLSQALGFPVPVVISDSAGRPWRLGTVGFAIGCYGLEPIWDQVGEQDLFGREMVVTAPAVADALAAAASLVQGETHQGRPAVWVTGFAARLSERANSRDLLRPAPGDLFR
jgi:coenzyme F420-0:L-glutamate ligase/coenzyme F420-1:gamma-L-glutamate ligase